MKWGSTLNVFDVLQDERSSDSRVVCVCVWICIGSSQLFEREHILHRSPRTFSMLTIHTPKGKKRLCKGREEKVIEVHCRSHHTNKLHSTLQQYRNCGSRYLTRVVLPSFVEACIFSLLSILSFQTPLPLSLQLMHNLSPSPSPLLTPLLPSDSCDPKHTEMFIDVPH